MKSKRIEWLDFAKGAIIFWVVIYHTLYLINWHGRGLFNYFSGATMMPIFFAISGYLYKPANTLKKFCILLYKKTISFFIPYVIFNVITILMQNIHHLKLLLIYWYKIILYPCGWLWFLYVLYLIFIIIGLIDLIHIPLYCQVLFALVLCYFSNVNTSFQSMFISEGKRLNPFVGILDPFKQIETYFCCFLLGYIIKIYMSKLRKIRLLNINVTLVGIGWIIILLINLKITHLFKAPIINNSLYQLMQLITIVLLFYIFINYNHESKIFNYFKKYGKYTLVIYLVHYPIIFIILPKIFIRYNITYLLNKFVVIVPINILLGLGISLLFCKLVKKYNIFNFMFYPRKYIDKIIFH